RTFNTRRDRDATTILGSSMGGLVSLYAFFRYPSIFGRAGVMSPSLWFGQGAILDFVREARAPQGRIYVDAGTAEGAGTLRDVRRAGRCGAARRGGAPRPAPGQEGLSPQACTHRGGAAGADGIGTPVRRRFGGPPLRGGVGRAPRGRAGVPVAHSFLRPTI